MNLYKLLGIAALLIVGACDKPEDKMQSTAAVTSASSMAPSMSASAMAPSMAPTAAMGSAHDMGMAADGGAMMAPAMGSMAAPAGSAPMMNDKKAKAMDPKMAPGTGH